MGKNRVFFPQAALDQWLQTDRVDFAGNQLVIKAEGRKYKIVEAIRVLDIVSEGQDVHEITGRVKTVAYLNELGAELLGDSMIIGEVAYQVVPGFLGTPMGSFAEHRASGGAPMSETPTPRPHAPKSDEELLAQYLIRNLD